MNKTNYIEMKQKCVRYYSENQLPQKLEELLNTLFIEDPDDIYGYLSEYFAKIAKPVTISVINCQPSFNLKGYENVTASVSCCVKGVVKHILNLQSFASDCPVKETVTSRMKSASISTSKKDAKRNKKESTSVEQISRESSKQVMSFEALSILQKDFVPVLLGCEISNQSNVDEKLRDVVQVMMELKPTNCLPPVTLSDIESEEIIQSEQVSQHTIATESEILQAECPQSELCNSSMFLSLLVAMATAKVKELPLYRSLMFSMETKECVTSSFPLPTLSLLSCEPSSPGKLMVFKEMMVVPKITVEPKQGINLMVKFSNYFEQALFAKFGAAGLLKNASGRFTPPCDKIEQAFELLLDTASTYMQIEFADMFDIIVDVGASQIYDEEKLKYDVILGAPSKAADVLIAMYKEWLQTYPIIAIINGLAGSDEEISLTMFQTISPKCSIFSDVEKEDVALQLIADKKVNGIVIRPEKTCSNLTDLFSYVASINDANDSECRIMLTDDWCTLQNSTAIIDLGVALNSTYIRIAPASSFGALSLSRLLQIYHQVHECNHQLTEKTHQLTDNLVESEIIESFHSR